MTAMAAPRKYPQELRERAVRLALESDRPIAQIAADLGIHREALRTWILAPVRTAPGTPARLTLTPTPTPRALALGRGRGWIQRRLPRRGTR
jgi:transposase